MSMPIGVQLPLHQLRNALEPVVAGEDETRERETRRHLLRAAAASTFNPDASSRSFAASGLNATGKRPCG